ncbi:cyclodeaminase/cyclohydrolase family protein [Patescibacteria group bacterium]|nr:cyclodeaminase/cyclohydrolase family protein [Patescibacteria group bacterium]
MTSPSLKKEFFLQVDQLTGLFSKGKPLGGGAGAALGGLVGVALLRRSLEFGSKDPELLVRLADIRKILKKTSWADGEVFAAFAKDKENVLKKKQIVEVPFEIGQQMINLMRLAVLMVKKEKGLMLGDIRAAQELIKGSFYAALEMVRGNLDYFGKKEQAELVARIDSLVNDFMGVCDET